VKEKSMVYRIEGLSEDVFSALSAMSDEDLAGRKARRVVADTDRGFPCRVTLEDARKGESLILLHYTSHDVATPYRTSYAIYVREGAAAPTPFVDCLPPVFEGRTLSLRGFARDGNIVEARLAQPGETDGTIRALFADPAIAYIHAHNAAYGCFAARIDRHQEDGQ
jgi:hypothetical protein